MILYKNVDIKDLDSILQNGILSLNECGNDNWDEGKRSDNSRDVVYLFLPLAEQNSFCNYGAALLEVEIPSDKVKENELGKCDVHNCEYVEYIVDKVDTDCIKRIYIPELFKSVVEDSGEISDEALSRITWCGFDATYYDDNGRKPCPDDIMKQFAETAEIMDAATFNFFRGKREDMRMIDLYDIKYIV